MRLFSKFEDHSLQHLRESLEKSNHRSPSLLPLIDNHHFYLKDSIAVLTDANAAADDKISALSRFLPVLKMHAKAEEETLYQRLLRDEVEIARIESLGGKDEHDIASFLADELEELGYATNWTETVDAKAKVLASLVRNHVREEETVLFPITRELVDDDELHALGEAYVEKCRNFLEEELNPTFAQSPNPPWSNLER